MFASARMIRVPLRVNVASVSRLWCRPFSKRSVIMDDLDNDSSGPLAPRIQHPDWVNELDSFELFRNGRDTPLSLELPGKQGVLPDNVEQWTRRHDREAGDDEAAGFRAHADSVVVDTKLVKAKRGSESGWASPRTQGPDSLIGMIVANKGNRDERVWFEIIDRIEYISSTLSVKKIRLLFQALAEVSPLPITDSGNAALNSMVHACGLELLCRYNSLTLFTCTSIIDSLSKLNCRHLGTLNILSQAIQQLVDSGERGLGDVTDQEVVGMIIQALEAYAKFEYILPAFVDTVAKALSERGDSVFIEQRIRVLFLLRGVEGFDTKLENWMVGSDSKGLDRISADAVKELLHVCLASGNPGMNQALDGLMRMRVELGRSPLTLNVREPGSRGRQVSVTVDEATISRVRGVLDAAPTS